MSREYNPNENTKEKSLQITLNNKINDITFNKEKQMKRIMDDKKAIQDLFCRLSDLQKENNGCPVLPQMLNLIHYGINCSQCNMKPLQGIRYQCSINNCKINLCSSCREKSNHPHDFIIIKKIKGLLAASVPSSSFSYSKDNPKTEFELEIINSGFIAWPCNTKLEIDKNNEFPVIIKNKTITGQINPQDKYIFKLNFPNCKRTQNGKYNSLVYLKDSNNNLISQINIQMEIYDNNTVILPFQSKTNNPSNKPCEVPSNCYQNVIVNNQDKYNVPIVNNDRCQFIEENKPKPLPINEVLNEDDDDNIFEGYKTSIDKTVNTSPNELYDNYQEIANGISPEKRLKFNQCMEELMKYNYRDFLLKGEIAKVVIESGYDINKSTTLILNRIEKINNNK